MKSCIAPWHAILVKWHGGVFPDSQYQGGYGNLRDKTLAELWKSPNAVSLRQKMAQGELPQECSQCSLKESSVGHSRRLFFRDVVQPWIEKPEIDPHAEPDIRYLEINTSNLCNLKCVMCSGAVSTAWIKDERALIAKGVEYQRPESSKVVWREWDPKWMYNLLADPAHFRNLRRLSLKGGEPLLDQRNADIMKFFVDSRIAKHVSLEITTNGTIIDENMLKLASRFERVLLYVSVEATGDLYQWIRGGHDFKFSDLEKNIHYFSSIPNFDLYITTLALAPNLWNLADLRDWVTSLPNITGITFRNIVVNPRYLDPHLIPTDLRKSALNIGSTDALHAFEKENGDTGFSNMVAALNEETMSPKEAEHQLSHFRAFVRDIDGLRGTNLGSIVPQLRDIL